MVILFLGAIAWAGHRDESGRITIAIEHGSPLSAQITVSKKGKQRLIEIGNDAVETMLLSVPEHWQRGEVRNAPLRAITSDTPEFGYVRWHVPPSAVVTFRGEGNWTALTVHNPTGVPLHIGLTTVDLDADTADHTAVLVKDGPVDVPYE